MSLRWVQVLAPRNSARTPARSDPSERPARRPALAAASGHSNHGSTAGRGLGVEHDERRRVDVADHGVLVHDGLALVVAVRVAEVGVDRPALARRGHARRSGAVDASPCTGSGPGSSCQANGSSPSSSDGASGPVTTGGLFSAKPCMIVPPAFQPAQRSACCSIARPSGAVLCIGARVLRVGPGAPTAPSRAAARTRRSARRRGGRRATGRRRRPTTS